MLGTGTLRGVEGLGAMSARYDCKDAAQRAAGITEATAALRKGELAVMPTDTVYGIAADAFSPEAVTALLAAKGRGRQMPPPVLVGSRRAALALVEDVSAPGNDLAQAPDWDHPPAQQPGHGSGHVHDRGGDVRGAWSVI